jgi:hypothetical protein
MIRIISTILLFNVLAFAQETEVNCPKNSEEWFQLKQQLVDQNINSNHKSFDTEYNDQFQKIAQACQEKGLDVPSKVNKCFDSFKSYAQVMGNNSTRRPLADFTIEQLTPDDPSKMELPEEFKSSLFQKVLVGEVDTDEAKKAYDQYLKKYPNSDIITHKDPFFGRRNMTMRTSDENYEVLHHFDNTDPSMNGAVLTMVIQKRAPDGSELNPRRIYFRDHKVGNQVNTTEKKKVIDGQPISYHQFETTNLTTTASHCFGCHRNGPATMALSNSSNPIVYSNKQEGADAREYVQKFNSSLHGLMNVELEGYKFPKKLSPPYGFNDTSNISDEFMKTCVKEGTDPASIPKIKGAMNCAACHNGQDSYELTYPFGPKSFKYGLDIIKGDIKSGHMPPGHSLDRQESENVFRCLNQDYFGDPEFNGSQAAIPIKKGKLIEYLTTNGCEELMQDFAPKISCDVSPLINEEIMKVGTYIADNGIIADKKVEHQIKDELSADEDFPDGLPQNLNLTEVKNAKGETIGFSRSVFTPVCYEGAGGSGGGCKPVSVEMQFDKTGKFLGLKPKEELTKIGHAPFKKEDYKKLGELLLQKDLPIMDIKNKGELIDGISGATVLKYQSQVVPGAAFTTYTLRKYVKATEEKIKNLKKK